MLQRIGHYTIGERVGYGAYGRVYRATDSKAREFAVKVAVNPAQPWQIEGFQQEMVAAAAVLHPVLVPVYDLAFEGNCPYLVMEFVEGKDLARLIRAQTKRSLPENIALMQKIAGALRSAHERGVLHLDLRPSKILINTSGDGRLIGLGLGRFSFDPARVVGDRYLVGSPFYMSPERLIATETANAQCDIWSFGVTFYEWLAGVHPFNADDGDQMIGKILHAVPAPIPGVPTRLNEILFRAMEKDPAQRYPTFAHLLRDLQALPEDLKREHAEALIAEALKETDSGHWREARQIARQLSNRNGVPPEAQPVDAPAPQLGRLQQPQLQPQAQIQHLPEPTWQPRPETEPNDDAAVAVAEAQAPEVTTPSTAAPAPLPSRPKAQPRVDVLRPNTSRARTDAGLRPPTYKPATRRVLQPQSDRYLLVKEPKKLPWVRIAGFVLAGLVAVAAPVIYFRGASKTHSPAAPARVVATSPSYTPAPTNVDAGTQPQTPAAASPTVSPTQTQAPIAVTVAGPQTPKVFDPNSLPRVKPATAPRRRGKGPLNGVNAPDLAPGEDDGSQAGAVPLAGDAPPAPAAPAQAPASEPQPTDQQAPAVDPPKSQTPVAQSAPRVTEPVLISRVAPVVPPAAMGAAGSREVRIQATVTKDGAVKNVKVISSNNSLLSGAARSAVLHWKFKPATLNGEAVEVTQTIVVRFDASR